MNRKASLSAVMIIFITSPPRAAPAPARTSRDLIKFNWFLSDQMQTRQFHFATFSKIGKHWACINLVSTKLSTFRMWFKIEEYKILVRYFCSLNFAPQGLDRMSHFTSNLLSTAVCLDIYISKYLLLLPSQDGIWGPGIYCCKIMIVWLLRSHCRYH